MKKIIIPMLAFLLVAGGQAVCPQGTAAKCSRTVVSDGQVSIPIIIKNEHQAPVGHPRTPAFVPMSAYYSVYAGGVVVTFSGDYGEVDAVLENLLTGASYVYTFDSAEMAILPIDGDAGLWTISFTLENGAEYVGEFEL